MRYILNDEGYIETISFGNEITCNDKTCTEYTGTIPEGYSSLAEWSENAVIQAYYLVDGNLTYDADKETELEAEWVKDYNLNNSSLLFDTSKRIIPTLLVGSHQDSYGGCYYYKIGTKVRVHIGVNGLTASTLHTIFTLPVGYRPDSYITNRGAGGKITMEAFGQVSPDGSVYAVSNDTYALVDIEFDAVK